MSCHRRGFPLPTGFLLPIYLLAVAVLVTAASFTGTSVLAAEETASKDDIAMEVVMVEDLDEDPVATGKAAAEKLKQAMGDRPLKAVVVSECFEDRENKEKLLEGICSVLPRSIVMGGATYGSFTQGGVTDYDAVCLMGLGGEGLGVSAKLVTDLGTAKLTFEKDEQEIAKRLRAAGEKLVSRVTRTDQDRLLLLIADAHSPKNQFLVEGAQQAVGKDFPITGGSVNKNAGQTFVYFDGKVHQDSAIALMLSGDFRVSLAGRRANTNDEVIRTAKVGAEEALKKTAGEPFAVMAFNCAGRRSKLKKYEDELAAMKKALGERTPLFGCYCAGEIGPVDDAEKSSDALSGGSGWHVMFTILSR